MPALSPGCQCSAIGTSGRVSRTHTEFFPNRGQSDSSTVGPFCNVKICNVEYFRCYLSVANAYNACFIKAVCGSCSMLCAMEQPVQHRPSLARCLPAVRTSVQYLAENPLTAQETNFLGTKNLQHSTY